MTESSKVANNKAKASDNLDRSRFNEDEIQVGKIIDSLKRMLSEQSTNPLHIQESAKGTPDNASKNFSSRSMLLDDGDGYNPPDIPPVPRIKNLIGECSKPFEKQLNSKDVSARRLRLNTDDVKNYLYPLLSEQEQADLKKGPSGGIPVTTYDMDGKSYPMEFKIWEKTMYVLTGEWKTLCQKLELRKYQDFVTVWMFRHVHTKKLGFVITCRKLPVSQHLSRNQMKKRAKRQ